MATKMAAVAAVRKQQNQGSMESLEERVEEALQQIRPYLEADRGNISLVEITDGMIARVELHGACRDCSMSFMTMRAGVEESIKSSVPEIKGVEAINSLVPTR